MIGRSRKEKLFLVVGYLLTIFILKFHYKQTVNNLSKDLTNGTVIITQNEGIRNQIAKKMRIFCWFIGKPANKERWIYLKKLWGHKCDRYVAMVSIDMDIPGMETHKLQFPEGRIHLWKMYLAIIKHIQENYINDYDFFMKCDDDS
jgi:glycoprotein-N-acetylgalactosamine 3-beta-galactosyltransferase